MSRKVALITGVTGQDGAYLTALLLAKGYAVHGLVRRTSSFNTGRIEELCKTLNEYPQNLFLHYGDVTDSGNILRIVQETAPEEIYNLAAQSHVEVSFQTPEYTANVDAIGALRVLEAIRILGLQDRTRFYQASTSELFGLAAQIPQNEHTAFHPRSPYAVAKLYAHWITVHYREAYRLHACNGILFNHESPLRGESFVSRKITRAVAAIAAGKTQPLLLGNLEARRDWGHARDYVDGMWRIMQHPTPQDWVLASGKTHTVREFATLAFAQIGKALEWRGTGLLETGIDRASGKILVTIDARLFRPAEADHLCGDASKARAELGWTPTTDFRQLVNEMVTADLARTSRGDT